jgi:serine/threonine protein kinase
METPESMQQLEDLFHEAAGLDPNERADFMTRLRDSKPALAAALESLIAAHEKPDSPIDSPAIEAAADLIAEPQPALVPGQIVGHYKIVSALGKGGMGEVYLAKDTKLDRQVALKLLAAQFTNHRDLLRRFVLEAKAASSLNHPNIITIHEIGEMGSVHFIATEFIDGLTLKQRMRHERLELADVLDIAIQTASALKAAHAAGLVHRDIKPENLMLRPDGYVKVLDFGLAKLTQKSGPVNSAESEAGTMLRGNTKPGTVMGTYDYMSPEQARGQDLDQRTDVFSLGIVLYEMAAGRRPFAAATSLDTLVSILQVEPAPLREYAPEVPAELQRIISKALRKDREERYQTINDLLIDLRTLKEELSFAQKLERSRPPRSHTELSTDSAVAEAPTTIQARAVPATEPPVITPVRSNKLFVLVALVVLVLTGFVIAAAVFWPHKGSTPVVSAPATTAELAISYWITVQKYRDGKPYQDPFRLTDDINFEKDYRIRLHMTSVESGHLYLLNEGTGSDGTPTYNVLFPSETANNASAVLTQNQEIQIPQQSWFQFDAEQGTEKIWVVWAPKEVPEMEAIKGFANSKDRGAISSPGLRTAVNEFFKAHSSPAPLVERDQDKKETTIKANGEILVHVIKLEHH